MGKITAGFCPAPNGAHALPDQPSRRAVVGHDPASGSPDRTSVGGRFVKPAIATMGVGMERFRCSWPDEAAGPAARRKATVQPCRAKVLRCACRRDHGKQGVAGAESVITVAGKARQSLLNSARPALKRSPQTEHERAQDPIPQSCRWDGARCLQTLQTILSFSSSVQRRPRPGPTISNRSIREPQLLLCIRTLTQHSTSHLILGRSDMRGPYSYGVSTEYPF